MSWRKHPGYYWAGFGAVLGACSAPAYVAVAAVLLIVAAIAICLLRATS